MEDTGPDDLAEQILEVLVVGSTAKSEMK
jgi:hypothetical protein